MLLSNIHTLYGFTILLSCLSDSEEYGVGLYYGVIGNPTSGALSLEFQLFVESESGVGPYNVKSIGENATIPVAAAIANAVEDAVGVRIKDLPITAEKVYRALQEKPYRFWG